jgi:hypothetical protein
VRHPAKVLFSLHFEASLDKGFSVLFQRRNVTLLLPYPAKSILEIAPKEWKAIVHIYNHTNAARSEQVKDIYRTIELFTGIVTISDSVDAKDEIKSAPQLRFLFFHSDRKIGQQRLVLCLVKLQALKLLLTKKVFSVALRCFNQDRRKISADCLFNPNAPAT